eukprot:3927771-Pyramimonas_sp.AAC.2
MRWRVLLVLDQCDVNQTDPAEGCSPLHRVCLHGNRDIVRLFLRHERTLVNVADSHGQTPLIVAVRGGHK